MKCSCVRQNVDDRNPTFWRAQLRRASVATKILLDRAQSQIQRSGRVNKMTKWECHRHVADAFHRRPVVSVQVAIRETVSICIVFCPHSSITLSDSWKDKKLKPACVGNCGKRRLGRRPNANYHSFAVVRSRSPRRLCDWSLDFVKEWATLRISNIICGRSAAKLATFRFHLGVNQRRPAAFSSLSWVMPRGHNPP